MPFLGPVESTVGTHIEVRHSAPTPVGQAVTCRARVVQAEGTKISFQLEAHNGHELIARGSSSQREDRNRASLDRTHATPGTRTAQPNPGTVPRVVLDTDTLVAAAYAEQSASRHILEACLWGEVQAIVSPALHKEYEYILKRAVRGRDFSDTFRRFLEQAEVVEPLETRRIVPDDPSDDKVVATALVASADAVITKDRHLLQLDPFDRLRILRPAEFVRLWLGG